MGALPPLQRAGGSWRIPEGWKWQFLTSQLAEGGDKSAGDGLELIVGQGDAMDALGDAPHGFVDSNREGHQLAVGQICAQRDPGKAPTTSVPCSPPPPHPVSPTPWGQLSSPGMPIPLLMGMEQGFPSGHLLAGFLTVMAGCPTARGGEGKKDLLVLLTSWSSCFVLSCVCFPSQETPGMETLHPSPRMGSASCPLPKATVGAGGASSTLPRFSQEDVESLRDEAPAPAILWFTSQGRESSGNKNEWLSSLSFDEVHPALAY